jgi:glycosyltransferase involved in cell wall biosynthesis
MITAKKPMVMVLAYNVEKTLEKTFQAVPDSLKPFVVVGDNCSTDDTPRVAARLGLRTVRHERNLNYGGNLKRLLRLAMEEGCDAAVELHGDFQYDPSLTDLMVEYISRGYFDMIQGNRIRSRSQALAGGMPLYRYLCNRTMTLGQNLWFGTTFGEWHSGLRAYSRRLIESAPLDSFSDTHAFASDILMHAVANGFWIGEVPCPARYDEESSSVPLLKLFDYAFKTFASALRYPPGWRSKLRPMPRLDPAFAASSPTNGIEKP